jgi:hypothetical protein
VSAQQDDFLLSTHATSQSLLNPNPKLSPSPDHPHYLSHLGNKGATPSSFLQAATEPKLVVLPLPLAVDDAAALLCP